MSNQSFRCYVEQSAKSETAGNSTF